MRVHEAAVFGNGAEPVGVAIGGHSSLAFLADNSFLQERDVRKDGLRIDAGKQRIQLTANFNVVDAGLGEDVLSALRDPSRTSHPRRT